MVQRELQTVIEQQFFKGKAIMVNGPRQSGKTTLLNQIASAATVPVQILNCNEPEVRALLTDANIQKLRSLIGAHKLVLIDEAQGVKNIGQALKLIVDTWPDIQLLVAGSSSMDIVGKVSEPLTGRVFAYHLYPLSLKELAVTFNRLSEQQSLEKRLIFGSYPRVIQLFGQEKSCLLSLSGSHLYNDVLACMDIRKPQQLEALLISLALQIGSEVSYHQLAQTIKADCKTVERYIWLLEQCFVIFKIGTFSLHRGNEVKKVKKIYFYDNGIRNAILQNFAPLNLRQDAGALWENYFVSERLKANHYRRRFANTFFWRTFQRQKIDLIEETDGILAAYAIRWNQSGRPKLPLAFTAVYPDHHFHAVDRTNYMDFLL
ncbi:MAG: ATP-binding protein [Bacteroidetes bacterium]|nr:ATP-binding protein [Bacteroidota bacterium]